MADGGLYERRRRVDAWIPPRKVTPAIGANGPEVGVARSPNGRSLSFARDTKGALTGEFFVRHTDGEKSWLPDCAMKE